MDGFAATAKNLADLEGDEAMLLECRRAHLREAARLICENVTPDDLSVDFEGFLEKYRNTCNEISAGSALYANDRVMLCSHIADILLEKSSQRSLLRVFCPSEEKPKEPVICYLKNPISDLAYIEFTRNTPDAGVLYADSFQAVCENLIGGECDYAILPVISGSDGRLVRFEGMIASCGFAVSALAAVTPNPDVATDTFALLSRSIEMPDRTDPASRLYFTFSVPANTALGGLLSAAEKNGIVPTDIGTQSSSARKNFSLTMDVTNGNIAAFLTYLALEESGFVANGLFTV